MKKMYEDEDDIELMSTSYHMNATDTSLEVSQLNNSNPANMSIEWGGKFGHVQLKQVYLLLLIVLYCCSFSFGSRSAICFRTNANVL